MAILNVVNRALQALGLRESPLHVIRIDELPDKLRKGCLYAIGEGEPWIGAFLCPCGCGDDIQVRLLFNDSPHWSLQINGDGSPSLVPSV